MKTWIMRLKIFINIVEYCLRLIRKHRDEDVDNEAKKSLLILLNTGRIDSTIDSGIATPAGAVGSVNIDGQTCNHDSTFEALRVIYL